MTIGAQDFIKKWKNAQGGERSQAQHFLNDFCDLIGTGRPMDGEYKFVYPVRTNTGTDFMDLYKRGTLIVEAKQTRFKSNKKNDGQADLLGPSGEQDAPSRTGRAWDVHMLNARQQAEGYARILPSAHDWPPFILVCDVGHCFEVYADFTGKGRRYEQFPDKQGFRVFMDDLADEKILERFKNIWENPHELNPAKAAAKATREIAKALAEVSKRLEAKKYPPEEVALFLMRCLFTMFAEDTELIPKDSFTDLLSRSTDHPQSFMPNLKELWTAMNAGSDFSIAIQSKVKKFNGKLFANAQVFPMGKEDIGVLKVAAEKVWTEVDPSIFGTLLEQALSVADRASLGAHYTPRAYVERLVNATVMDPLWAEWENVKGSLELDPKDALERVRAFHQKLCEIRVLDPACGTGNFLYISLELMKKLEGDVLDMLEQLGGQEALRLERFTVDPHQFLGIEKNPRAAAIAELVLWIGYLRWHLKTKGEQPPEPILREFKNIERRDAVLDHDGVDVNGKYIRPRRPAWPEAEYIVGNPPFIAGQSFRREFGDEYAETIWRINPQIPGGADFVMFWWDRAAELLTRKNTALKRFGFVTTNSITQTFQARVVANHLSAKNRISILMAIPDHPWTTVTKDAAAVSIAFTVVSAGDHNGKLLLAISSSGIDTDTPVIEFSEIQGKINSDLTVGADLTKCIKLDANIGVAHDGIKFHGIGFAINAQEAIHLGLETREGLTNYIRPLRNGRDLAGKSRKLHAIDLFGLNAEQVRLKYPEVYQHLSQTVKKQRELQLAKSPTADAKAYFQNWWIFGKPRQELRPALGNLKSYLATVDTAKHRVFQPLDAQTICDDGIVVVATSSYFHLGVLSGSIHCIWTLAQGSLLGPTPRYNKTKCFDPFPFPAATEEQRTEIARIAEALDKHRKDAQSRHPEITLTQMYNVLEKVRAKAELSPDEKLIFDNALILILKELHDELDAAVAVAYGWPKDLPEAEVLARLVALNKERAAEEAKGFVRWLRPEYQIPRFGSESDKKQLEADFGGEEQKPAVASKTAKPTFPNGVIDQVAAVMAALALRENSITAVELAREFKQGKKCEGRIAATLASLTRTGFIASNPEQSSFAIRRAV